MLTVTKALKSSIGRKFIMGLSGLALVGFIIAHLAGNLTLLDPTGVLFNAYAKKLDDLGPLKIVAEVGLVILFGLHILMAFVLKVDHRSARPSRYAMHKSKGGPSFWNLASVNMIVTGAVLLGFLVIHIKQFTLGPGVDAGYVTDIHGTSGRDLFRLITETFANPWWVAFYCGVMLMLGAHLRHGFWSMFQSLGAMSPRLQKPAHLAGLIVGVIMAVGFLMLPLYLHFYVAQGGSL
jgi:succinate dehydrogenase / fumarate reductase cytochrome b subunit